MKFHHWNRSRKRTLKLSACQIYQFPREKRIAMNKSHLQNWWKMKGMVRVHGVPIFHWFIYSRSSRVGSRQTRVPIRKQPSRNNKLTQTSFDTRNQCCQTELVFLESTEQELITEQVRESAKKELNKILEEERKQQQIEVKKLKKKQWCALCLKEGTYLQF